MRTKCRNCQMPIQIDTYFKTDNSINIDTVILQLFCNNCGRLQALSFMPKPMELEKGEDVEQQKAYKKELTSKPSYLG